MRFNRWIRAAVFAGAAFLAAGMPGMQASAAGESGSITIYLHGSAGQAQDIPLSGAEVKLYFAAEQTADGQWTASETFADAGFELKDLSAASLEENAQRLYAYVQDHGLKGDAAVTDDSGRAVWDALETGMYLVCPPKEISYESRAESGVFLTEPYLVTVPLDVGGEPDYSVESVPKTEWIPDEPDGETPGGPEEPGEPGGETPEEPDEPGTPDRGEPGIIQTGDNAKFSNYIVWILVSGVVIADMIAERKRRR